MSWTVLRMSWEGGGQTVTGLALQVVTRRSCCTRAVLRFCVNLGPAALCVSEQLYRRSMVRAQVSATMGGVFAEVAEEDLQERVMSSIALRLRDVLVQHGACR